VGLRPIETFVGLLFEAGLSPANAISAVDAVAQFVLGGAVGYYHHTFDAEGQQGEFEALSPDEFPNMTRVLSEAHFVGHEGEFEFGLDAIVRGLLSGPRCEL